MIWPKPILSIQLDAIDVVAGDSLTGRVECERPILADDVHLELRHSTKHGNSWTEHTERVRVPSGQLHPDHGLNIAIDIPSWIAPSFIGKRVDHRWELFLAVDRPEFHWASTGFRIHPALPGVAVDACSAEPVWHKIRELSQSRTRLHESRAKTMASNALFQWPALFAVAGVLVDRRFGHSWAAAVAAIAAIAMLFAVQRFLRLRALNPLGLVAIVECPEVLESGQQFRVGIDIQHPESAGVLLRCTEWLYEDGDGGGSAKPFIAFESQAVRESGQWVMTVPRDALPSVAVGPSAVLWEVVVEYPVAGAEQVIAAAESLIVLARASTTSPVITTS